MTIGRYFGKTLLLAAVAMTLALAPGQSHAAKGILKLHEGDWTGNLVVCKLLEVILEDEMDYKVKRIFMPAGPAVSEAIIGGEIDFACESWPSYSTTKEKYLTKWGGDGSIAYLGDTGVVGQSGWYVPRYVLEGDAARGIEAAAPDLKSWDQLNDLKDIFKSPESGDQGRLLACPVAAWECKEAERVAGLKLDYMAVELGSETAHWAEIEAAYKRGEPILAYAWEPHWIHAKFDLVEVALPAHSDEAWPVSDWPEDVTYNYGSVELQDTYPDAYQLINNFQLSNTQQAEIILAVDVDGVELDKAVRAWMAENEAIWKSWIPATN